MIRSLLRKGLLEVLVSNALMQLVGFVTLLVLPRLVDPAVFGGIRVLQSIGDLLVVAGGFGYGTALLATCATGDEDRLHHGLLHGSIRRTLLASTVVWILAVLVSKSGVYAASPDVERWLPWFALGVPLMTLGQLLASFLHARNRLREMARAQGLVKLQAAVLVIVATWQFGIAGFVVAWIVAAIVGLLPYIRRVGTDFLAVPPDPLPVPFSRVARHGVTANLLQIAGRYADLLVLGVLIPDAFDLGPYALATVLILPVFVVASSVQAAGIPGFGLLTHDRPELARRAARLQWETIGLALVVAIAIRLTAPPLITLFYDASYAATLPFLDILLVHAVLRSAGSILAGAHIALGRTGYNVIASAVSAILGLSIGVIALKMFSLVGVAWAQVATSAFVAILYPVFFSMAMRPGTPTHSSVAG